MKCTNNGLLEFPEERQAIMLDIKHLMSICLDNKGHLGDVVACIETTISSLKLKSNRLKEVFEKQKLTV